MPATTYDRTTPGPASLDATSPVITKIPAPMIAPTPSDVSPTGPSTRRSRFSPFASASSISSVFFAKIRFQNISVLFFVAIIPGVRRTSPLRLAVDGPPQKVYGNARHYDKKTRPGVHRL